MSEFGTYPVGGDSDEYGSPGVGGNSDEFGAQVPGHPAYSRPFPGYGGPVGPGKGSVGVPIGIGTVVALAGAAAAALTRANPRGPMRIRRVLIQTAGTNTGVTFAGRCKGTVTAMTVAGFPLIDGVLGTDVFDGLNESPPEFNQIWEPGIPFTINITAAAVKPITQSFSVTVICSAL